MFRSAITRITAQGLGRNSALAVVQTGFGALSLIVVYKLLIHYEGTDALGLWSLTVGVVSLARLADVSGGSALARLVAIDGQEEAAASAAQYIDTVTLFVLALYGALILAAYLPLRSAFQYLVEQEALEQARTLIPYALVSLVLLVAGMAQTSALDGAQRADLRAWVLICGFAIFAVLGTILIPRKGLIGLAIAQLVQQGFILFAARLLLARQVAGLGFLPVKASRAAFRDALSYGFRLQIMGLAALIFDPVARIMVNQYAGLSVLGIYELAYRLVTQFRMLIVAASQPLIPAFAGLGLQGNAKSSTLLAQANRIVIPAAAAAFSATILVSPLVGWYFLNEHSTLFFFHVVVFAVAYYVNTASMPLFLYAQANGMLTWNIVGQASLAVLTVAFCAVIASFGMADYSGAGVALALILGTAISWWGNIHLPGTGGLKSVASGTLLKGLAGLAAACAVTWFFSARVS